MDLQTILQAVQNATQTPPALAALQAPAAAPATPPARASIGGVLGGLVSPQAGSFWSSALNGGLLDARANQQKTLQSAQAAADADKAAQLKAKQDALAAADKHAASLADRSQDGIYNAGGNIGVVRIGADGKAQILTPPPLQQTETERLIDRWHALPPGDPERDLIERVLKNFQYTDPVIEAQGDARTKTTVAGKEAQRFAPRAPTKAAAGTVTGPIVRDNN